MSEKLHATYLLTFVLVVTPPSCPHFHDDPFSPHGGRLLWKTSKLNLMHTAYYGDFIVSSFQIAGVLVFHSSIDEFQPYMHLLASRHLFIT